MPYQAAFVEEEEDGLQAASIAISQPPKNKGRRPEEVWFQNNSKLRIVTASTEI